MKELRLAGIRDIETANGWIREVYLPAHNARFAHPPAIDESGFVGVDRERLVATLVIEEGRTVGRDNTIAWAGRRLQIPESRLRHHYVGCHVKVQVRWDATLAILHGARVIARFTSDGAPLIEMATQPGPRDANAAAESVAPRSAPSRRGLARAEHVDSPERRPALTGPRRDAKTPASRKGKRCAA